MTPLEIRYRRLLRWYPAPHRREHEDEIVGVLLAGAEPGRERPGARDAADLLAGAARIRASRAVRRAGAGRRDAIALIGVAAPVLLAASQLISLAVLVKNQGWRHESLLSSAAGLRLGFAVLALLLVAAVWSGARRASLATAWPLAGLALAGTLTGAFRDPTLGWYYQRPSVALVTLTAMAALALSVPGSVARGLELVGTGRLGRLALALAAAYALQRLSPQRFDGTFLATAQQPIVFAVLAFWAGRAVRTSAGRTAVALLAVPAMASMYTVNQITGHTSGVLHTLPLTALLAAVPVFAITAVWTVQRRWADRVEVTVREPA